MEEKVSKKKKDAMADPYLPPKPTCLSIIKYGQEIGR